MHKLINSNDAVLMGEHHNVEDGGGYGIHSVHITPPEDYIVMQVSSQDFNAYVDRLSD